MRYVDFCDAAAYCVWAGKRLCGKIGGGQYPLGEGATGVSGEWTNACTQGGKFELPTGAGPDPMPCKDYSNGVESCKAQTIPPFDQLMALGVVLPEWIDSCGDTSPPNGSTYYACNVAGPNVTQTPTPCNSMYPGPATVHEPALSFRCCAE